ncbi:MAG: hypothetical protein IJW70_02920 [Clostridia bacterium]|nr:hypothetical protein [Clostridia bacterium]
MKKILSMLILAAMLLSVLALTVSAEEYDYITAANFYEHEATKRDEVYEGEAGIASTKWTVPYLRVTPELDGKIGTGEYERFDNYEDYLFYSVCMGRCNVDDFQAFMNATKDGFFDVYWGWDGQYLYMAFDMDCVDGYFCDPVGMYGGASYLYACTSVQFGIGQADAEYRQFSETGFGINPDGNTGLTHAWLGNYFPDAEKDVAGTYNETANRLTIEFRVNLQLALNMDTTVKNGDQARICWLLNCGGDGDNLKSKQVSFCHGIGGTQSGKASQLFATVTFDGLPDDVDIPIHEREEISEIDQEYDLRDIANFSRDDAIEAFSGQDATIEKMTEGEETFIRITATGDNAYIYSSKYPRSVSSDTKYAVIKYRSSSAKADDLGLIYRSTSLKEYDLNEAAYEKIQADGNWHYMYIDMNGETHWNDWIVSLGIVPFLGVEGAAGEYVDIAWIKFYHEDPWDIPEYEEDRNATTPTTEETTTEPVAETTDAPTADSTEAPTEEVTTEAEQSGNCKGIVAAPVVALVAMLGVAFVAKKKD